MEIKNTTVMDKKFFVCFQRLTIRGPRAVLVIFIIASLILAFGSAVSLYEAIYLIVYFNDFSALPSSLVTPLILIFWVCWVTFLPSFMFKRSHIRNATVKYTFFDEKFASETVGEGYNSTLEYSYSSIKRVYESAKCFVIYIDKMSVCAVDKEGFSGEEDAVLLREKLMSIIGKKKYLIRK